MVICLNLAWGRALFLFFQPVEAFFGGDFYFYLRPFLPSLAQQLEARRALLLIAAGISVVLWLFMREEMIWFGILHFLAAAILLFALFRPLLDRVPPLAGLLVCALLFLITWWVPGYRDGVFGIPGVLSFPVPDALTEILWLYPLGLSYLPSSDYFPVLPWIFWLPRRKLCRRLGRAGTFPGLYVSTARSFFLLDRQTYADYLYPSSAGHLWNMFGDFPAGPAIRKRGNRRRGFLEKRRKC